MEQMRKFYVGGVKIAFPYDPYPSQIVIMNKIINSLNKREHGIFESPTGTGKSITILSSAIGWLLQELGKSRADGSGEPVPKIYIASRTQGQVKQLIRELRLKTILKPRIAVLGSRDHLCIHPEKVNWEDRTDACLSLGTACPYMENYEVLAHSSVKNQIADIEDLVKAGDALAACPYYASRELAKHANVVFAPYNYFVDPSNVHFTRYSIGLQHQSGRQHLDYR
jgi:Rad3-related DNA helicase